MGILAIAAGDLQAILTDSAGGFGVPMTLTAPDGSSQSITGFSADIGLTVDPETGQNVSGRTAHVTLPTASLSIGTPVGIQDGSRKPWRVTLQLPGAAAPETFKINETMPDKLGALVCFLEVWS